MTRKEKALPAFAALEGQGDCCLTNQSFSKPAPERPAEAVARFGRSTLIRLDASGRRALARCGCGTIRQLAVEAIGDGSVARGWGECAASLPTFTAERRKGGRS